MVRIKTIQVRLTRQQYDQIKNDCMIKGFNSLSAYIRFIALHRDQLLAKKIMEIHDAVVGSLKTGRKMRYSSSEQLQNCL